MLTDLALNQMILRVVAAVLLAGVYGFVFAGVARLLGDPGPGYDGRLTPNPFVHLDLMAVVATLFSRVGWIRPIALDPKAMRFGVWGAAICLAVTTIALIFLAFLLARLRSFPVLFLDPSLSLATANAMQTFAEVAVWFAVFNLIPLPPLGAGAILVALAPKATKPLLRNGFWMSFALTALMIGTGGDWLDPVAGTLSRAILR